MKIREVLKQGILILKLNNIEEANTKARILLSAILNKSKEYIIIHDDEEINEESFFQGIQKLTKNIPIQYIVNNQEFMKLNFYVDENVLIPQPDTEILVEEVINLSKSMDKKISILDLCTGSGCIAISLAKNIDTSNIVAIDISEKSIQIAKLNAEKNKINDKIEFVKSDMFNKIENKYKFDYIVSNPPYIKTDVINTLSDEVKNEPYIALDGGKDGLQFYRKIVTQSKDYLKSNGYLCIEIGYDQKEDVIELLKNAGEYKEIYSKKDLSGNDRIVIARKV